jgi:hypothetical protein
VWQFVVCRGLVPIVMGLAAGLGLSLVTTSLLQEQLYGATPQYLPASRAMRLPPIVALNDG